MYIHHNTYPEVTPYGDKTLPNNGSKYGWSLDSTKPFPNPNIDLRLSAPISSQFHRKSARFDGKNCYIILKDYAFARVQWINLSPPGRNGRHFVNDIFKCMFVNEKSYILIKIALKFVPIDNNPALVKIVVWRLIGDNSLSELILARFTDTYMRH